MFLELQISLQKRPSQHLQTMALYTTGLVNGHVIFVFSHGKHLMY